jgi:hypothetical protein
VGILITLLLLQLKGRGFPIDLLPLPRRVNNVQGVFNHPCSSAIEGNPKGIIVHHSSSVDERGKTMRGFAPPSFLSRRRKGHLVRGKYPSSFLCSMEGFITRGFSGRPFSSAVGRDVC